MRALVIRLIAILSALALFPLTAAFALGGELNSDCGIPSDIHDGWVNGSPEQQGVDPALLCAMGKGITDGKLPNVDSVVVVRHGALVYERYFTYPRKPWLVFDATTRHEGNSMTKSVTSLLFGIAVDRGLIKDLDASAFSFFPEYTYLHAPENDRITLRHLLTMSAGWQWDEMKDWRRLLSASDPYRYALYRKMAEEPGHSFEYDSGSTELLGAVLQKVTGKTIDVLAKEELFDPLGIVDVVWTRRLHNGNPLAAAGLEARPRDWAKLGQLVLNHGAWHGKQIVSSSWIDLSITAAKSTKISDGSPSRMSYGFQWWLGRSNCEGRVIDWAAAVGFNSQKILIAPALDLVVAFNASSQSKEMIAPEIVLLDKYVLPAILKR